MVCLLLGTELFIVLQNPLHTYAAGSNWTQFDNDPQHSGNNMQESSISSQNVASLQIMFRVSLPAIADGAPVYFGGVHTASGNRDLLFVTTRNGAIIALDAHSGAQIWAAQYGSASCTINTSGPLCYTTSSPAIDPNGQYVYSYGLDGYVHKDQIGNGSEVSGGGWPELVTTKSYDEKGSSALSIATANNGSSYLYITNGGYPGDRGDYQGHLTTVNLSNGSQHVFNTLCSNQVDVHFVEGGNPDCQQKQAAVWGRAGVIYNASLDKIYLATGNGDYNPGASSWGDSVLELNPDGTGSNGQPLDSYTPTNFAALQGQDLDLGSTDPALLPSNQAVQSGKDGELRVINLNNLSGQGSPGHIGGEMSVIPVPQGGEVKTQPAVWTNPGDGATWVFVANEQGISGLQLSGSTLQPRWQLNTGGSSPFIANNVLYYLTNGGARALNPTNGKMLWQDNEPNINLHWESPIVINGVLYYSDGSGHLSAFSLPSNATRYNRIFNYNSGRVLGVAGASLRAGTPIIQWLDNGSSDQSWRLTSAGSGFYKIFNYNSNQVLGVAGASTAAGATVVQWPDNGSFDQQWRLIDANNGFSKIVNRNSGLVLAVSGASTAVGAPIIQWPDTGTNDHMWWLLPA